MAPDVSTEKLGRYEILSELGQGAMGVVYKAIDPLIDRTLAIKTIKFDLSRDDFANFEERFYREAKSAGRLNHPNIVTIHDVGKSDNTAYIAMEFLEGQLLKQVLDVHTAMSIDKIVDIAAQIADGLAYAHKNGIVHRDIKPANIMLVHGDVVKITDFGIARMSACSETLAGTVLGSPKYMAPEQVVGKAVDGRSDLFSLGVVLYEMLTGESPFYGDNINTTMYRIVNEAPTPPQTLTPRIPEAFNYIVAKALAKHPDERYQSAGGLAHDLRNYKDLSIPAATTAALDHTIPLERKPRPRSTIGEETIFLPPKSGGPIGNNTLAGDVQPTHTHPLPFNAGGSFYGQHKKMLIAASMVLFLTFTLIVMRDGPAPQVRVAQPVQTAVAPAKPALAEKPAANARRAEDASRSSKLSKAAPPATKPQIAATPVAAVSVNTTPLAPKTLKPETAPREMPTASPLAVAPGGEALLSFAVTPWGDVYVDGKKVGASPPLKELRLPAGKHKIEIRNLNFAPYSQTLHLKADSSKKLKYIFK